MNNNTSYKVKLPCKVETKIYYIVDELESRIFKGNKCLIRDYEYMGIAELTISQFNVQDKISMSFYELPGFRILLSQIGISVYLSLEEAEKTMRRKDFLKFWKNATSFGGCAHYSKWRD